MTPQEKLEIAEVLEASRSDFNAAVAEVPDSLAATCPEPGRWSVLECAEHVTIVENIFLGRLENNYAYQKVLHTDSSEPAHSNKAKEADLMAQVPDRSVRRQAPEAAQPNGRFQSLADAMEKFNDARTRTIEFAKERGPDLYWLSMSHPRFGELNGVEFLLVVAGHARRHAAQIWEARAALGIG